jgi:hypothetical protein
MRDKLPLMATAMQLVYVSLFYKLAFALVHPFRAFVLVRSLEISICLFCVQLLLCITISGN